MGEWWRYYKDFLFRQEGDAVGRQNDPKGIGDGPLENGGQSCAFEFGCMGVHTPLFPWVKEES